MSANWKDSWSATAAEYEIIDIQIRNSNKGIPEKLKECMLEEEVRDDTYDTIAEAVGERRMKKYRPKEEGGKIKMCKAIDMLIADGEKRGLERGFKRGIEQERVRTEQERTRAERECVRAEQAEARVRELERQLECYRSGI